MHENMPPGIGVLIALALGSMAVFQRRREIAAWLGWRKDD